MKFHNIPSVKLELNQDTRDHALAQLLIQTGVNQFLLKGIYSQLYSITPQEVEATAKEIESTESAYIFQTLAHYAVESNLSQLSRPPSPTHEDLKG